MIKNKLAVAIKHNGKILRETKDVVHLPFGSEFSVLVKNLNSRRVKFKLSIDGADALDDTEIIVNANSETEIKRFIRNGNMDEGNAFKFIERTSGIENGPRGIKIDDGIVRVEFWFEQEKPEIVIKDIYWEKHYYRDFYPQANPWYDRRFGNGIYGSVAKGAVANDTTDYNSATFSATAAVATDSTVDTALRSMINAQSATEQSVPMNDVGITVPGAKVEQKFTTVYGFKSELNSSTIILRLVGVVGEVEVEKPITVAHKPTCTSCGRVNKANAKFCTDCGTALVLL